MKKEDKEALIEKYSNMSKSELHAESLRLSNLKLAKYPDTFKLKISSAPDLKIIKELIELKRNE